MSNSTKTTFDRRLIALAFADVAGYSRLMIVDEMGTVTRWEQLRTQVLEPLLNEARGVIVEIRGDSLLIEFASLIDAINWAMNAQRATARKWEKDDTHAHRMRNAINIEDVIGEERLIHSDCINIEER